MKKLLIVPLFLFAILIPFKAHATTYPAMSAYPITSGKHYIILQDTNGSAMKFEWDTTNPIKFMLWQNTSTGNWWYGWTNGNGGSINYTGYQVGTTSVGGSGSYTANYANGFGVNSVAGSYWNGVKTDSYIYDQTATKVTYAPNLGADTITYIGNNSILTNNTIQCRFTANIGFDIANDITSMQYSFNGSDFYPIFKSDGSCATNVVSSTLAFTSSKKMFSGDIVLNIPVTSGIVNNLSLYIKDPNGTVVTTNYTISLVNPPSNGGSGSATNSMTTAPDRSNYSDGLLGDIQYGFALLVYYIKLPFISFSSFVQNLGSNIADLVSQFGGFTTYISTIFSSFPTWITTPITTLLSIMIAVTIIKFIRG